MLKTKTERVLLLLVAFLAGCEASHLARTGFNVPEANAQVPAQRFQYYCLRATDNITDQANKLGQQGWELVAAAGSGSGMGFSQSETMVWCFKHAPLAAAVQ
jgi:hypothetical protein